MATSNNGHQLNESSNYPPTFTDTYVQLSLDSPPFGFVMQLTPQRLWFVHRPSPISSLFCHGPNIRYPIYTPIVGMSGFYHLVGIVSQSTSPYNCFIFIIFLIVSTWCDSQVTRVYLLSSQQVSLTSYVLSYEKVYYCNADEESCTWRTGRKIFRPVLVF